MLLSFKTEGSVSSTEIESWCLGNILVEVAKFISLLQVD